MTSILCRSLCGKELKVIDLKYIRMVKDKRELELMWRAVKIADEAYLRLLDELQPGMTEKLWLAAWNTICAAWEQKNSLLKLS